MSSNNSLSVAGDLSVGRSAVVGGGLTVRGDAVFRGGLRVDGWLDADHVRGCHKGMYRTAQALMSRHPHPDDGWWALVGVSIPAAVWVSEGGSWVDTGGSGGVEGVSFPDFDVPLGALRADLTVVAVDTVSNAGRVGALEESVDDLDARVDGVVSSVETLSGRVSENRGYIDAQGGELVRHWQRMDTLSSALNGEIATRTSAEAGLDARVDGVVSSVETLSGRVSENRDYIHAQGDELVRHLQRIDTLASALNGEIATRTSAEAGLGARMDVFDVVEVAMDARLGALEARADALRHDVSALDGGVCDMRCHLRDEASVRNARDVETDARLDTLDVRVCCLSDRQWELRNAVEANNALCDENAVMIAEERVHRRAADEALSARVSAIEGGAVFLTEAEYEYLSGAGRVDEGKMYYIFEEE